MKNSKDRILSEEVLQAKIKESLQIKKAMEILKNMSEPIIQEIKDHFQATKTEGGTKLTQYDSEFGGYTYVESDNIKPDPDKIKAILGDVVYKAVTEKKVVVNKDKLKAYLMINKIPESKLKKAGLREPKTPSLRPDFDRIPFDIIAQNNPPSRKDIFSSLANIITMLDNRPVIAAPDDRSHTLAHEEIVNNTD